MDDKYENLWILAWGLVAALLASFARSSLRLSVLHLILSELQRLHLFCLLLQY